MRETTSLSACGTSVACSGWRLKTTVTQSTRWRRCESCIVRSSCSIGWNCARAIRIWMGPRVGMAMLEPESGVVMARRSVQTLIAELARKGVHVRRGRAVRPTASGRMSEVRLMDGAALSGDVFVFACGAWLPSVFPELLGPRITPTRQVVMYFGTGAGDERLAASHMPAWVDFASGIYGVPDLEGRGLKVGIDTHGAPFDPDTGDRCIDEDSIQIARAWLQRRLPSMADAPLVESRVCQYAKHIYRRLPDRSSSGPRERLARGRRVPVTASSTDRRSASTRPVSLRATRRRKPALRSSRKAPYLSARSTESLDRSKGSVRGRIAAPFLLTADDCEDSVPLPDVGSIAFGRRVNHGPTDWNSRRGCNPLCHVRRPGVHLGAEQGCPPRNARHHER